MQPESTVRWHAHLSQDLQLRQKISGDHIERHSGSLRCGKRAQVVRPTGDIGGPVLPSAHGVYANAIFFPTTFAVGPGEASRNAVSGVPFGCPTLEWEGGRRVDARCWTEILPGWLTRSRPIHFVWRNRFYD